MKTLIVFLFLTSLAYGAEKVPEARTLLPDGIEWNLSLEPNPMYFFEPQENMTAWELAQLLPWINGSQWTNWMTREFPNLVMKDPRLARHFRIERR